MAALNFPLFRPALDEPPEVLPPNISDLMDREVRRAALVGSDPDAVERASLTVDLPVDALDALQALANATGSSRRAMAGKLLNTAIWQSVNELSRYANGSEAVPEYQAVWLEFHDELNAIKAARE